VGAWQTTPERRDSRCFTNGPYHSFAGPGTCVYIPADVYHSTLNTGGETMQLIVAYSPAGPERLLREIPGCKGCGCCRITDHNDN